MADVDPIFPDQKHPAQKMTSTKPDRLNDTKIPASRPQLSSRRRRQSTTTRKRGHSQHLDATTASPYAEVYSGSFARSAHSRANSIRNSKLGANQNSSRKSVSHLQLEHLLSGIHDTEIYGLHELRDGFFDAPFSRPSPYQPTEYEDEQTAKHLSTTGSLIEVIWQLAYGQWDGLLSVYEDVVFTRAGVRLLKAFLGFFSAYIVCLIPISRRWLGELYFIMPVSVLINHPARSFGSQLDGAIMTCTGMVVGLLWGSLALYTTTATINAARGFGAAVVPFLMLFTSILSWLRCVFNRFFQAIICAGVALFYMCLAEDLFVSEGLNASIWRRTSKFALPFALGQVLSLVVNIVIAPSAGNRPLALSFHAALESIRATLVLPRPRSLARNRELAFHFVQISQVVRDFTLDLSVSKYTPDDARPLRNLLQGVLRAMIALEPDTTLFTISEDTSLRRVTELEPIEIVARTMAQPTRNLIETLDQSIRLADSAIMHISGLSTYKDVQAATTSSLKSMIVLLQSSCSSFDEAESSLVQRGAQAPGYSMTDTNIVQLFLFIHPIRLASDKVALLLAKVLEMLAAKPRWRFQLPSYPWSKAFYRMNPTVRHDRGGLTAAYYFQSKRELDRTMDELQSRDWKPLNKRRKSRDQHVLKRSKTLLDQDNEGPEETRGDSSNFRNRVWSVVHRLQNFETRFALKMTLLCTLLSIPGLLPQSASWWYSHDCWWVVVTVWIMMHPRVGGNIVDIFIRTSCATLGAIWAGAGFAAGSGNLYVMAVFGALFMIPMLYRLTQSKHPRSGIIGCLSFTVVSMKLYDPTPSSSVLEIVWTRGLIFIVGVVTAIVVNWVLWPFVARHELRKSLSTMVLNSAIIYRSVIARYIYYSEGQAPGQEAIERSEMLESRLREGFVRIRQLMELTRHEIRLRAPFDPLPYGALIDACEEFFDKLIDVRQSSLFFRPDHPSAFDNLKHNILALRRDAVGTILMNLYILAGALRSHRPLPKYLPSAAQARRRLLDAMELMEAEKAERDKGENHGMHDWNEVYKFAYSSTLTDVVGQVQELESRTREIVGVIGSPNNPSH